MAVKAKNTKSIKTRVSKKAKKNTDKKLFIALGVLLVAIIAVVGIVYYRQSQASNVSRLYKDFVQSEYYTSNGTFSPILYSSRTWINTNTRFPNGQRRFIRYNAGGSITCANISTKNNFKSTNTNYRWYQGQEVIVTEVYNCYPRN